MLKCLIFVASVIAVVFLLHVAAIVGIYTYNSSKIAHAAQATPAPAASAPSVTVSHKEPTSQAPVPSVSGHNYMVQKGDRLLVIAQRFNVSPDELIAANKLRNPDRLQVGQPLKIPISRN